MRFVKTLDNISGLPYGYTEVEYLASNGNQYIDTGYNPGANAGTFTFDIGVKNTYAQSGRGAIGSRSIDAGRNWVIASTVNEGTTFQQFGYGNTYTNVNCASSDKYQRLRSYLTDTDYVVDARMDGSVYSSSFTKQTFTNTANVYLFGINNKGSLFSSFPFIGNMYYAKMYQDGVLVRDYIPCLDPLGVPCMYDKVGRKPYYNVGTGDFTYGRKIIPVKYVRTTGVQYINTGYRPHSETVVETKFKMNESTTNNFKWIFLARNNTVAGDGYGFGCNGSGYITSDYNNRVSGDQRFVSGTTYTIVKDKNICKVNNIVLTNEVSTFTVNYPLCMFTLNDHGNIATTTTLPSLDCYYFKISDQNGLMRDYIPVRDENNVGYMFDRVSHFLFGNTGGGELGIGEDIYAHKLRLIKDGGELPIGYKRLDYIQTSGTQYIDTGVVAKSGLSSVLNFEYTDVATTYSMLDARSGNNRFYLCHCGRPSSTSYFYYGYGSATQSSTTPVTNTRYFVETSLASGSQSMKVNGTTIASGSDSSTYNLGVNLYLFGMNYSTPQYLAKAKLYCCKIKDGDTLVRDYVPCLDPTGTPCLFDKVSRTAFYNAGTGSFTYGHILTPVEYLESSGTQYIDTGINADSNLNIEFKYKLNSTSSVSRFGALNSTGTLRHHIQCNNMAVIEYFANTNSNNPSVSIPTDTKPHTMYIDVASRKVKYDSGEYAFSGTAGSFNCGMNYWLFKRNSNNTTYQTGFNGRIYYTKMWYSGVLVRDLVPVRDENNVGYMLDKVYGTIYSNIGTDSFALGSDYPKKSVRIVNSVFPDYEIGEYIQASGTQYIDTGFKPNNNTTIECITSFTNSFNIAACRWSGSPTYDTYGFYKSTSSQINKPIVGYYGKYSDDEIAYAYNYVDNTKVKMTISPTIFAVKSVDNSSYNVQQTITQSAYQSPYNLWIFEDNNLGSPIGGSTGVCKMYDFKIWDDGVLVRNFLPAKRKSDNEVGMLDIVNKVFYTNLGSGSFTFQPKG